jgi:hypothetical protein
VHMTFREISILASSVFLCNFGGRYLPLKSVSFPSPWLSPFLVVVHRRIFISFTVHSNWNRILITYNNNKPVIK